MLYQYASKKIKLVPYIKGGKNNMNIKIIDDVPRKGFCAMCHKVSSSTITVLISSKGSPIANTEDWCLKHYHYINRSTIKDKTA